MDLRQQAALTFNAASAHGSVVMRDRLIARRTSTINQIRAFLLERGITFRQGRAFLLRTMPSILEDPEQRLSPMMRGLLSVLYKQWQELEHSIDELSSRIEKLAETDEACKRLRTIPGVGPLVSTAMVAALGNGSAFTKGRHFAAWLGLVPRQHSTGGKPKLLGISRRGNNYLRRMFIHGARSVVTQVRRDRHPLGMWMNSLEARAHRNVLVVALANKIARIAWAVLNAGKPFESSFAVAARL